MDDLEAVLQVQVGRKRDGHLLEISLVRQSGLLRGLGIGSDAKCPLGWDMKDGGQQDPAVVTDLAEQRCVRRAATAEAKADGERFCRAIVVRLHAYEELLLFEAEGSGRARVGAGIGRPAWLLVQSILAGR
ncbi:hypothetical protein [Aeoliella sp.]|uniref:hypothetical protein n=1 Tax=Aeoliella sp. TaxID=2795800 RepID=UPI003CCBD0C7